MTNQQLKTRIQRLEVALQVKANENAAHEKVLADNGITDEETYNEWMEKTDANIQCLSSEAEILLGRIDTLLTAAEDFFDS